MISLLFYNSVLMFSTLFVYLANKIKKNHFSFLFLFLAFLLVFLPSAIRYDIGTDYLSYVDIYEDLFLLENYRFREPLFYFSNVVLRSLGAHYQWVFVLFSFLFTFAVFKLYRVNNAWLLHFLFFSMLWLFSFNGIRQAIAISFCLVALFKFIEGRYFYFILVTLIASAFHQSAMFVLILGVVALLPIGWNLKSRFVPYLFISVIIISYVTVWTILPYIEAVLKILNLKYAIYFSDFRHLSERDAGSGLAALVKILFSIIFITKSRALLILNHNYWLLIILIFFYGTSVAFASNIVIFGRMADIFSFAIVAGAYAIWNLPTEQKKNKLLISFFLFFLLLTFSKDSLGKETYYSNPKINPYQTIFHDYK